jgi:hypothetical protein
VSLEPLFLGRNPKAGTDKQLDERFERAMSAREFARAHGWPLPQPERFKWRRCLLVILGALLATLLLGRLLESLRAADQRPTAPPLADARISGHYLQEPLLFEVGLQKAEPIQSKLPFRFG